MPETKTKKRNPLLIDLPPEEPPEDGNGDGGLPYELQPTIVFQDLFNRDPFALYQARYFDYLQDRVRQGVETIERASEKAEMMNVYFQLNFPLEEMPDFDLVMNLRKVPMGENLKRIYEEYAQTYIENKRVERFQDEVRRAKFVDQVAGYYGEDLDTPVTSGLITSDEANSVQQLRIQQRETARAGILGDQYSRYGRLAPQIRAGTITEGEAAGKMRQEGLELAGVNQPLGGSLARTLMQSPQNRMLLAESVARGDITSEEAWGAGTPWENWQHEQAQQFNAQAPNVRPPAEWKGIGQTPIEAMGIPDDITWRFRQTQMENEGLARRNAEYAQSKFYSNVFPEQFQKFMTTGRTAFPGGSPTDVFGAWMKQQPDYDKTLMEFGKQYGDIYPEYEKYYKTPQTPIDADENMPEMLNFPKWLQENPIGQEWSEQKRLRDEEKLAAAKRRLVPPGVYRG